MSQFSQKYYKHYFVPKKRELKEDEFEFWAWSRTYRFFEIIIILLLLLILFCVCFKSAQNRATPMTTSSYSQVSSAAVEVPKISLSNTKEKKEPKEEKTQKKPQEQVQTKSLTLEDKIPKRVLPELSKLIPKKEVTLEQYMYYVNDTNEGFPSYVDKSTNRIIKEKKPSCATLDCPVSGITKADKNAYAEWLSEQGSVKYKVLESGSSFKVVSE